MSKLVTGLRATAQVANFAADLVESYGASAIGVISNANNSKKGKGGKNSKKNNGIQKKNGKPGKDNGKKSVRNRKK